MSDNLQTSCNPFSFVVVPQGAAFGFVRTANCRLRFCTRPYSMVSVFIFSVFISHFCVCKSVYKCVILTLQQKIRMSGKFEIK